MRRLLTYARSMTVLSLIALVPSQRPPPSSQPSARPRAQTDLRDSLLALDRRWGQAYVRGDSAFVAGFVADDWQGWLDDHPDNKASTMAAVTGTPHSLEDIVDQATVRLFGQMAVIQARERNRVSDAGGSHWVTRHITDVFVHRPEGWVVVASHDSRIPNP